VGDGAVPVVCCRYGGEEGQFRVGDIKREFKKMVKRVMVQRVAEGGQRVDGRAPTQV
jgi:polyribonucleotide nucleotidyltransferase